MELMTFFGIRYHMDSSAIDVDSELIEQIKMPKTPRLSQFRFSFPDSNTGSCNATMDAASSHARKYGRSCLNCKVPGGASQCQT